MRDWIISIVLALILAAVILNGIMLWADTGPGCPGNPEWLGYCHKLFNPEAPQ